MTGPDPEASRQTLAEDERPPLARAALEPGDRIQRYEVRRLVGAGGGGRVYAAFDPELDREVALKVLNTHGRSAVRGTSGTQRLIREARAMASLSHPNVAEVHHVGTIDAGVFIAMELLPGGTLTEWIFDVPRRWDTVLDKFVAAGRGLAHAHAHGMVHRDFKPDNVLLTAQGEPRVLDFGLARREDRPTPSSDTPTPAETLEPISGMSSHLGTPAYMAPEQHLGTEVDARADQFAFAVALYEALYGRRPYHGRTLAELAVAVTTTAPEYPPTDRTVPRRIWRALRRALARDPDDRWPDMEALLTTLTVDRRPARRWTLGALSVVGVGGVVLAFAPAGNDAAAPCEVGAGRIDGVWSEDRQREVSDAFARTHLPYANEALDTIGKRLHTWSAAWRGAYVGACQAAQRASARDEAGDTRMRCLSRQLDDVGALVAVLVEANESIVARAADIAARVPPVTRCDGSDARGRSEARAAPADLAQLDAVHRDVAEVRALAVAGRTEEGLEKAKALYERTREHAVPRARAEGELRLGTMLERAGDYDAAQTHLAEAEHIAVAADLQDLAVEAGLQLTYLIGYRLSRPDEGLRWARTTHAAIERGGGDPDAVAQLLNSEAAIHERLGDYQAAFDEFDRAREMTEAAHGPGHPSLGRNLVNMGLMLHRLDRDAAAEPHLLRALDLIEQSRGKSHPLVASALNNLGIVLEHQGRTDEAQQRYRAALELGERANGTEHPSLVSPLNNLANLAWASDRRDEAIDLVRRGLAIRERAFGPDHPRTAFSVRALGEFLSQRGRTAEALRLQRRALASYETALGPDHPEVAATLEKLGRSLARAGRTDEALVHYDRALQIRRESLGADHLDFARTQLRIGQAHARAGAMDEARRWFERARPKLVADLPESNADRKAVLAGPSNGGD